MTEAPTFPAPLILSQSKDEHLHPEGMCRRMSAVPAFPALLILSAVPHLSRPAHPEDLHPEGMCRRMSTCIPKGCVEG